MGVDPGTRYELLSRPDCHLCEEMAAVLDEVLPSFGLDYRVRDVDSDEESRRRFGDAIPVLLRNGVPVAKIRIDRGSLRRIVRRRR